MASGYVPHVARIASPNEQQAKDDVPPLVLRPE
jgi:hypothetical protein